jgi:PleD family two-component response regulator
MEQVKQTVVRNLRQSDVVAQYSSCQLVIMLPYANLEDSYMVMDRVISAYRSTGPQNAIRISYQIRELELL